MSTQPGHQTDFGANEWLVYEIRQQYLKDPDSVSEAWREFLSDSTPTDGADAITLRLHRRCDRLPALRVKKLQAYSLG